MYVMYSPMDTNGRAGRLRAARIARGYKTASEAAHAHKWNTNTYASNENGNAPYSFARAMEYAEAFGVRPDWLYSGATSDMDMAMDAAKRVTEILVPIIGRVGADPEGTVLFATGQDIGDLAPLPPGGTRKAIALRVVGHSMSGFADEGGLIYFEDQRTPPAEDMLGHVVVVETDAEEVLVKRLLRGSQAGVYDLESIIGPTRRDCKLRWAAHITAIVPPYQARKIIRSTGV